MAVNSEKRENAYKFVEPEFMHVAPSNKLVRPTNITEEDIDIRDITRSLSMQCRYNGYTSYPYSIAQHTIVMFEAARQMGMSGKVLVWVLLHDAPEAYLSDIPAPVKYSLGILAQLVELEREICIEFAKKWSIPFPDVTEWQTIQDLDYSIGALECEHFGITINNNRQPKWEFGLKDTLGRSTFRDFLVQRNWWDVEARYRELLAWWLVNHES